MAYWKLVEVEDCTKVGNGELFTKILDLEPFTRYCFHFVPDRRWQSVVKSFCLHDAVFISYEIGILFICKKGMEHTELACYHIKGRPIRYEMKTVTYEWSLKCHFMRFIEIAKQTNNWIARIFIGQYYRELIHHYMKLLQYTLNN